LALTPAAIILLAKVWRRSWSPGAQVRRLPMRRRGGEAAVSDASVDRAPARWRTTGRSSGGSSGLGDQRGAERVGPQSALCANLPWTSASRSAARSRPNFARHGARAGRGLPPTTPAPESPRVADGATDQYPRHATAPPGEWRRRSLANRDEAPPTTPFRSGSPGYDGA
jgi:hypothetical protein